MYCTHCGARNSDTAKFCRSCGRPMEAESGDETVFLDSGEREAAQEASKNIGAGQNPQTWKNPQAWNGQNPQEWEGQNSQEWEGQNAQTWNGRDGAGYQGGYSGQYYGQQVPPSHGGPPPQTRKKRRKGIIIALIVILLAVAAGGIGYVAVTQSDPMAPVHAMVSAAKKGNWGKVYDSIYWEDQEYTREEFISEANGTAGLASLGLNVANFEVRKVSESPSYVGEDGLTRKDLVVSMSFSVMGISPGEAEETEVTVVRTGMKFLFIPEWKIDSRDSGGFGF